MSSGVTVVGSIALDTVDTPAGKSVDALGGSATFISLAASHYTDVNIVGIIGTDFPDAGIDLFKKFNVDMEGLEKAEGKTFRWTGHYHEDVNYRDTLETQLNVFENFHPKLPDRAREADYLFLGNIHPELQLEVLEQAQPRFIAMDTMNLWIEIAREDLKKVLGRVHALIINNEEVDQLTGHRNPVHGAHALMEMGPEIVVIKKGEHGALLFEGDCVFSAPALPMETVVDPTGAGDTFAGGFLGYIAQKSNRDWNTLRQAVIHGSVIASFTCEAFGPNRLAELTDRDIALRYENFVELARF